MYFVFFLQPSLRNIVFYILVGWYRFDVTSAVLRWLTIKNSKSLTKVSNRLTIEKGEIIVSKNNATISVPFNHQEQKNSFIPRGIFQKATLQISSEKQFDYIDSRQKRETYQTARKRKNSSRPRPSRRKKGVNCRLRKRPLDFVEVNLASLPYMFGWKSNSSIFKMLV